MLEKKIIVTGGTYGIGASVVALLVAQNATVAALARTANLGEKQAAQLSAKGPGKVRFYRCDVSNRLQVKSAFAAAAVDMDGVDALVHVAGVESGAKPEEETDEVWNRLFEINAKGTFITNQEVFPYLKEKGGTIINFGSGAGVVGLPTNAVYAASKSAVMGWTRSIAHAWGKHNITVNVICPSVWTPMYEQHRARYTKEELLEHDKNMARLHHIGGRLGDPDRDLAPIISFLCGDGARYITGQTLCVDGGAVKVR